MSPALPAMASVNAETEGGETAVMELLAKVLVFLGVVAMWWYFGRQIIRTIAAFRNGLEGRDDDDGNR